MLARTSSAMPKPKQANPRKRSAHRIASDKKDGGCLNCCIVLWLQRNNNALVVCTLRARFQQFHAPYFTCASNVCAAVRLEVKANNIDRSYFRDAFGQQV